MYTMYNKNSANRIRATVKMRMRQARQTLCCLRRKASRMSMPPSWTTHQTSIVPLRRLLRSGKLSMPRGNSSAKPRLSTVFTVSDAATSRHIRHDDFSGGLRNSNYGYGGCTWPPNPSLPSPPLIFSAPSPPLKSS